MLNNELMGGNPQCYYKIMQLDFILNWLVNVICVFKCEGGKNTRKQKLCINNDQMDKLSQL